MCRKIIFAWPSHAGLVRFCSKKCRDDSMRDMERARKEEFLQSLGYKVLRFSGKTMDKFSEKQLANKVFNMLHLLSN